jgi:dUTP pyrophosphatase
MKVRIKKLHPDAVIPTYAKHGDGAMDLRSVSVSHDYTNDYLEYDTGIIYEIPEGYIGLLLPRSSITNKNMVLKNSIGLIDSGYRGSIKFRFIQVGGVNIYDIGDKVGQILILPYPQIELEEVEELSDSERNIGGFGSSGV